jgi:hypothetical protein
MPRHLSLKEMKNLGAAIDGRIMDNGEKRFSLKVGNRGYIWTEPPADITPAWQNAHFHAGLRETYIVERGAIVLAYGFRLYEQSAPENLVQIFERGKMFTVEPGEQQNVYLFAGSAVHTVQHGLPVPNPAKTSGVDWYEADSAFDAWSKSLSESDMKRLDSESMHRHQ